MPRSFSILVASFVVLIASLVQLQSTHNSSRRLPQNTFLLDNLSLSTKVQSLPPARQSVHIPGTQPVATIWRGAITPVKLPRHAKEAPLFIKIPTKKPVVFLGIDDGWTQSPEIQNWLLGHKLPFTLFLENDAIKNNYNYFRTFQSAGMSIEDHTLHHPELPGLTYKEQRSEICSTAKIYSRVYGQRPRLFRPPYGEYNDDTKKAAAACGMRAIILWHAVIQDGEMQYQDLSHLERGDIILTHFTPDFLDNMKALSAQLNRQHLQLGHLEDWLQ